MAPISRKSSPGFTLNYVKQKLTIPGKGKKWIFGDDILPNINTPEAVKLRLIIDRCLWRLRSGDRIANVFSVV